MRGGRTTFPNTPALTPLSTLMVSPISGTLTFLAKQNGHPAFIPAEMPGEIGWLFGIGLEIPTCLKANLRAE